MFYVGIVFCFFKFKLANKSRSIIIPQEVMHGMTRISFESVELQKLWPRF